MPRPNPFGRILTKWSAYYVHTFWLLSALLIKLFLTIITITTNIKDDQLKVDNDFFSVLLKRDHFGGKSVWCKDVVCDRWYKDWRYCGAEDLNETAPKVTFIFCFVIFAQRERSQLKSYIKVTFIQTCTLFNHQDYPVLLVIVPNHISDCASLLIILWMDFNKLAALLKRELVAFNVLSMFYF